MLFLCSYVRIGSSAAVAMMSALSRVNPRQRTWKRTAAQGCSASFAGGELGLEKIMSALVAAHA